jgi:hypothetical protein
MVPLRFSLRSLTQCEYKFGVIFDRGMSARVSWIDACVSRYVSFNSRVNCVRRAINYYPSKPRVETRGYNTVTPSGFEVL